MVLVEVLIHASAFMVSVAYFSGLAPADTVAQALVYISSTYLAVSYTASLVNSFYSPTLSSATANNDTVFSPVEPAFVAENVPDVRAPEPSAAFDDSADERREMEAAFIRDGWTPIVTMGGKYIHWGKEGHSTPPSSRTNVDAVDDANIFQSARTYSQEHHRQSPYFIPSLKAILTVVGAVVVAILSALCLAVWYSQSDYAAAESARIAQQALRRRPLQKPIAIPPHVNNSSDAPTSLEEYGVGLDTIIEPDAVPNDQFNNSNANTDPSPTGASSSATTSSSSTSEESDASSVSVNPSPGQASIRHFPTIHTIAPKHPYTIDDFKIERTLAHGAGSVLQVARCLHADGRTVVIKKTNKVLCSKLSVRRPALEERWILERLTLENAEDETKHALIIKLFASFHDESDLYMVLEHHLCDLHTRMSHYHGRDMSFPSELLRFYMAELCTAVVGLHAIGIAHRDIKPENILIDRDGHIVLCDFGLAAERMPRINHGTEFISPSWVRDGNAIEHAFNDGHMVGTPYYTAPEILLGWDHGFAVDWWGVGAVMFTVHAGKRPYEDLVNKRQQAGDTRRGSDIANWLTIIGEYPGIPDGMTKTAEDFLVGLMQLNPQLRLDDFAVKHHAYIRETKYSWDDLASRRTTPPPDALDMPDMQDPWSDNTADCHTYEALVNEAKREGRTPPDESRYFKRYNFVLPEGM
ncbi:kinase-like protein [Schizophyllum commune H4-8]|uniref:kinase-like protein n=1 Tax=Schizophyllum commune (strain H4-8 / FGSC 9210) TaxID=578458 RepID=UPI00216012D1|nr:kinase-like protein [Schizophyllum commune H4-8]KAI5887493.1 kinase-like protein [Schizophyllum commune H4-8]